MAPPPTSEELLDLPDVGRIRRNRMQELGAYGPPDEELWHQRSSSSWRPSSSSSSSGARHASFRPVEVDFEELRHRRNAQAAFASLRAGEELVRAAAAQTAAGSEHTDTSDPLALRPRLQRFQRAIGGDSSASGSRQLRSDIEASAETSASLQRVGSASRNRPSSRPLSLAGSGVVPSRSSDQARWGGSSPSRVTASFEDDMVVVPEVGQLRRRQLRQLEAFLRAPPDVRVDMQDMPDLSGLTSQQLERLDAWLSSADGMSLQSRPSSRTLLQDRREHSRAMPVVVHASASPMASSCQCGEKQWVVDDDEFVALAAEAEKLLSREAAKWRDHECPICCCAVTDDAVTLPCAGWGCMSLFHGDCIRSWLERQPNCPLCRTEFRHLARRQAGRATAAQCPLLASWLAAIASEERLFRMGRVSAGEAAQGEDENVITQGATFQVGSRRNPADATMRLHAESPGLAFIRMVFAADHAGGLLPRDRGVPEAATSREPVDSVAATTSTSSATLPASPVFRTVSSPARHAVAMPASAASATHSALRASSAAEGERSQLASHPRLSHDGFDGAEVPLAVSTPAAAASTVARARSPPGAAAGAVSSSVPESHTEAAAALVSEWSRSRTRARAAGRLQRESSVASASGNGPASASQALHPGGSAAAATGRGMAPHASQAVSSVSAATRSSSTSQGFFSWLADPSSTSGARSTWRSRGGGGGGAASGGRGAGGVAASHAPEVHETSSTLRMSGSLSALAETALRVGRGATITPAS